MPNHSEQFTLGPRVKGAGGVEIATYHHGGDGQPVMLVHATGFHGRIWIPLARRLTDRFSVWSVDQRGHGDSGKDPSGRYDWGVFTEDLLTVLDTIGGGPWSGGGHSLGGAVLLMAEGRRPGTFSSLCCYEPVVFPRGAMGGGAPPGGTPPGGTPRPSLADLSRKRRPSFASREAAFDNYASKLPFSRFRRDALEAYVEFGFKDSEDGTVILACAREDEAAIFDGAPLAPAWDVLPDVRIPVLVLGGSDPDDPVSRIAPSVAQHLPRGGYRRLGDLDHFGPFEDPDGVAELMAAAFAGGSISDWPSV